MTVQELTKIKNINFGILKSRIARKVVYLSKISVIKIISRHLPILGINKKTEIFYVIR